tara:strand:- start:103 stop:279 length:177 start_codon:yes stop_codon:yes gene_type:complete
MSIRSIGAIVAFLFVFLGLMSMVGNVHVAEFFGSLALGFIAALVAWFKLPKPASINRG